MSEQAGELGVLCSQEDYGFHFLPILFSVTKVPLSVSLSISGCIDDDERVVEAAAAFETTTSDTSLLTRPAVNHQQTVTPASNPGEEEEQAYLRRTRPARLAEEKIQVPRCLSPLN